MYKTLEKIYHINEEQYNEEYLQRFNSAYSVHLDIPISGNNCFYVVTPDIIYNLININKLNTKTVIIFNSLPGAAFTQFMKKSLIDEIVLTNNIEGVNSTRAEIGNIVEALEEKKSTSKFSGIVNHYYMLLSNKKINIKSCSDIRNVYNKLLLSDIKKENSKYVPDGKYFRKGMVSVYSKTQTEKHRGVYPEEEINKCMKKALDHLNDNEIDLLLRISAFHYLLGYIHPFYDGNGRLNRFISSYMLSLELFPLISLSISYYIHKHENDYMKAFDVCNHKLNKGEITYFIEYFTGVIKNGLVDINNKLNKKMKLWVTYKNNLKDFCKTNKLSNSFHDTTYLLLQGELFSDEGISTRDLMKELGVTRITLNKRLDLVRNLGLLKEMKIGRRKFYKLNISKLK